MTDNYTDSSLGFSDDRGHYCLVITMDAGTRSSIEVIRGDQGQMTDTLDLIRRIQSHLLRMDDHQRARQTAKLLEESAIELIRLIVEVEDE